MFNSKGGFSFFMAFDIGDLVKGKVVAIKDFGVLVEVDEGKKGLIHISKISDSYVKDVKSIFQIGQEIEAKIIGFTKDGKFDLSTRKSDLKSEKKGDHDQGQGSSHNYEKRLFEKKLSRFMKESDRKLSDLRKSMNKRLKTSKYKKK